MPPSTTEKMALTPARISSSRWRPPGLGGGITSLIRAHSASGRSGGYGVAVIPPVYRTGATYGRLFKQPLTYFLLFRCSMLDMTIMAWLIRHKKLALSCRQMLAAKLWYKGSSTPQELRARPVRFALLSGWVGLWRRTESSSKTDHNVFDHAD